MSIVHSWVRIQERKRGHRRFAGQRQELPGRLADARPSAPRPGGQAAVGPLDALAAQQLGDELAEGDGLAVGDEVGLARSCLSRPRGSDPRRRCRHGRYRSRCGRRRPRRTGPSRPSRPSPAAASCRPCPRRTGAAAPRSRSPHGWRRATASSASRLGRRIGRPRVRPQRRRLVDADQRLAGHQRRLGAAVHEAPHARLCAGRRARCGCPRRCRARSPPMAPTRPGGRPAGRRLSAAGRARRRARRGRPRSPRTASAPSALHFRGGARRSGPAPAPAGLRRRRRSISLPPMKPEPPVTNAVAAIAADPSSALATVGERPGRAGVSRGVQFASWLPVQRLGDCL